MYGHRLDVRSRATVLRFDGLLEFSVGAFHSRYDTTFLPVKPCSDASMARAVKLWFNRLMTKDEITNWAIANGWQMLDGALSLTKPSAPHPAIVRLVLKATIVSLEIKKPAGKWEKVAS